MKFFRKLKEAAEQAAHADLMIGIIADDVREIKRYVKRYVRSLNSIENREERLKSKEEYFEGWEKRLREREDEIIMSNNKLWAQVNRYKEVLEKNNIHVTYEETPQ